MRKIILLFCLFLAISKSFAQSDIALQNLEKARDSLNALKKDTSYLPRHLEDGIRRIDAIMKKISADKKQDTKTVESIIRKFNFIKEKLININEEVKQIEVQRLRLESQFSTASEKVKEGDIETVYAYKPYQEDLNTYFRLIKRLKRKEKFTALNIGRIINKETKYPLITTLIDKYLDQIKDELTLEIEELQQTIDNLREDTAKLNSDILNLFTDKKRFEIVNNDLQVRNDGLKKDNANLDIVRQQNNNIIGSLNAYILQIKEDSIKTQTFIDAKKLELIDVRDELTLVLKNLEIEQLNILEAQNSLKIANDSLGYVEENLKFMIDSLALTKDSLQSYSAKLSLAAKKDIRQNIILGVLALMVLLSQYQRLKNVRKANQNIQKANEQLKVLIRELHHRTKNNFQQISSLLYLQREEIDDAQLREVLTDACSRIDTLGMIHRQLYQKEEQTLTTIDMKEYTHDLVAHLLKSNSDPSKNIKTDIQVESLFLEMDIAVQIGLLLNELIQNCFKHAFKTTNNPLLTVHIFKKNQLLNIMVKDNGQGLREGISLKKLDSFGLKLVKLMVESNDGELEYKNENGAVFNISMPFTEVKSAPPQY